MANKQKQPLFKANNSMLYPDYMLQGLTLIELRQLEE